MIVASSKKSKVFHYSYCKYAKQIDKSNLLIFKNKDDARAHGFKHCSCCSRMIKYYNQDKSTIDKYLKDNGLTMYIDDDTMYIDNIFSSWKITVNPRGYDLILYHANTESYHKLTRVNGRFQHTYHLQNYKDDKSILKMLKYIVEHDKWKENNLEKFKSLPTNTKKQRSERNKAKKNYKKVKTRNVLNLLDKIKNENNRE